jgi:hypothetical protein
MQIFAKHNMASSESKYSTGKPHCECEEAICPRVIHRNRTMDDGTAPPCLRAGAPDTGAHARSADAFASLYGPLKRFMLSSTDHARSTPRADAREAAGPVRRHHRVRANTGVPTASADASISSDDDAIVKTAGPRKHDSIVYKKYVSYKIKYRRDFVRAEFERYFCGPQMPFCCKKPHHFYLTGGYVRPACWYKQAVRTGEALAIVPPSFPDWYDKVYSVPKEEKRRARAAAAAEKAWLAETEQAVYAAMEAVYDDEKAAFEEFLLT